MKSCRQKSSWQKHKILRAREEFEDAVLLYTKAFELWPENTKITNRLATLYLVNLGMNAKAVYYAKESLKHDPKNAQRCSLRGNWLSQYAKNF